MKAIDWIKELPVAATVCDPQGVILEMNDHSVKAFAADGGAALIGTNALDCHPEPARAKMRAMLAAGRKNVYTIEKRGIKKLIYQCPWTEGGVYRGFVELAMEIPFEMPHFVRG
jgi:hypothetical protein